MLRTLTSINSTTVRLTTEIFARRVALRASSRFAPELAAAWAERLFLTPPRARHPERALADFIDARPRAIMHRGRRIATWRWGARAAPVVLLAHGWGGSARQMRNFVFPLVTAGFRVVAFDQPAHGLSEGRLTGLPDLADAFAAVAADHGSPHGELRGIVAHSFGGAAAALALASGRLHAARDIPIVLIAPPSDLLGYSRRFARWYWIPERVRDAMQAAIEERYGVRWRELEVSRLAPRLTAPALVIHDRDDRIVPWNQGAYLARAWPGARLLVTGGLGHARILESDTVTHAAADFISGRSRVADPAWPALPQPAPLY